jgi:hypothetical protein
MCIFHDPLKAYASTVAYLSEEKLYERTSEVANNMEEAEVTQGPETDWQTNTTERAPQG